MLPKATGALRMSSLALLEASARGVWAPVVPWSLCLRNLRNKPHMAQALAPTLYLEIGKQWSLMLLRSSSSASKHSLSCAAAWSRCFRRESSCACFTNVRLQRFVGRYSVKKLLGYSAVLAPEPPNSSGKSFSFGKPSFIRSTVS
jgi:hypothetical protein